jgi:hypothetical protein
MNKLIIGLTISVVLYGCFYYTQYSKNKKISEKKITKPDNNNKSDEDIIEDIIDEIITNVIIEKKQYDNSEKNPSEKKVSFDDNWITINP